MDRVKIMHQASISRRSLLVLGGAGLLAASACDALSTEPSDQQQAGEHDVDAKEAPELAAQVADGSLPPLEERLPSNPLVVEPVDRPGTYGGQWRTSLLGVADAVWMQRTVGYECLLRASPDFSEVLPNLAESYELNADGTEYVFALREGVRWSDGEPFTANDLVFAHNDVLNNRELYPNEPANPATAEKVDDHTVRITFRRPEGLYVINQAAAHGRDAVRLPMHYLQQFHADYNPDIDQLVAEEGVADWQTLFLNKAGLAGPPGAFWENTELPTINPWRTVEALGEGGRAIVERNPYYWKVDPLGRQLPYLDRVTFEVINDAEVMLLRAIEGNIDMQDRNIATPTNKPELAAGRAGGEYGFFDTKTTDMNTTGIAFNHTHTDPVKREIFTNKDFRIGLSHAINRQEIIDVVFQRQGEPYQMCPRPESRFFNEQLARQYTEYDLDLANQHLDEAGYTERDSNGYRLGPEGRRITVNLTFVTSWTPEWSDVAQLLTEYWREVGIDIQPQTQDRSLWLERGAANTFDASLWAGECGGDMDTVLRPMWYLPIDGTVTPGPLWREWYGSQGEGGEEPPELVRRTMTLYDELRATPHEDEQAALMEEILQTTAEHFNVMGIGLAPDGYGVVKNTFHNVPSPVHVSAPFHNPGPTNPEQYFSSAQ